MPLKPGIQEHQENQKDREDTDEEIEDRIQIVEVDLILRICILKGRLGKYESHDGQYKGVDHQQRQIIFLKPDGGIGKKPAYIDIIRDQIDIVRDRLNDLIFRRKIRLYQPHQITEKPHKDRHHEPNGNHAVFSHIIQGFVDQK